MVFKLSIKLSSTDSKTLANALAEIAAVHLVQGVVVGNWPVLLDSGEEIGRWSIAETN